MSLIPVAGWSAPRGRLSEAMARAATLEAQLAAAQADNAALRNTIEQLAAARDGEARLAEEAARRQDGMIDSLSDALERLAAGDLSVRIYDAFPSAFDQVRIDFNASMEALNRVMDSILEATEGVSFGAAELSRAAERLSSRTEQQAASVSESARSLNELSADVANNTDRAEGVLGSVGAARDQASTSREAIGRAACAMDDIQASSAQIKQISEVIDDIAFQTNMLALNAGIEAARAGDAGRGFAIVAAEVRALSQRTATAAKEITELVARSDMDVAKGVRDVADARRSLETVVERVAEVSGLAAGMADSNRSQAANIGQINTAVVRIDEITRINAGMVAETREGTQALAEEASSLAGSVARFKRQLSAAGEEAEPAQEEAQAEIERLFG